MKTKRLTINEKINFMSFGLSWHDNPVSKGLLTIVKKEVHDEIYGRIAAHPHQEYIVKPGKRHSKYPNKR